jgi:hypothetical protein
MAKVERREAVRKVSDEPAALPYGLPKNLLRLISLSVYQPNSRLERCSHPFSDSFSRQLGE